MAKSDLLKTDGNLMRDLDTVQATNEKLQQRREELQVEVASQAQELQKEKEVQKRTQPQEKQIYPKKKKKQYTNTNCTIHPVKQQCPRYKYCM